MISWLLGRASIKTLPFLMVALGVVVDVALVAGITTVSCVLLIASGVSFAVVRVKVIELFVCSMILSVVACRARTYRPMVPIGAVQILSFCDASHWQWLRNSSLLLNGE